MIAVMYGVTLTSIKTCLTLASMEPAIRKVTAAETIKGIKHDSSSSFPNICSHITFLS